MLSIIVVLLLNLLPSEATSTTLKQNINKLFFELNTTIKKHSSAISSHYETFIIREKVRTGLITQMWSNLLSTSDFSIEYYDEPKLWLEENNKVLDDLYKGLIYLPLSLGGGRKVIYMGGIEGGEMMALEVSDSSLQTLISLHWVSNPFWSAHRPKSINPLCKEADKQNLKLCLGVTCEWIRLLAKNIILKKYQATLHKRATYVNQCMELDSNAFRRVKKRFTKKLKSKQNSYSQAHSST